MILHCENCNTRYLLPSHSLAPDGRRVRCTVCNHEWFQDYDDGDYVVENDDEDDLEPIPESVRPIPEGSNVPSLEVQDDVDHFPVGGILASIAVFGIIFGALVHFKEPITNFWPQSGAFYELLGMEPPLPGEGLIFDQLKGTSDNGEQGGLLIDLSGNIVNLSADKVPLPPMRFTLNDEADEHTDVWYMPPVQDYIEAHGEVQFHTVHESEATAAQGVSVGFLSGHISSADDESAEDEQESDDAEEDTASSGDESHEEDSEHNADPAHH